MGKSQYIIQFGGLPVGLHDFEFDVDGTFFQKTENSEVQTANIQVDATLTKQNNLLQMHFTIYGTVGLDCDRCLKYFDYPIDATGDLVIKHGNTSESTDEILVIPEGQEEFDISQYLYEYIVLAIPARRVPCELDETSFVCDFETLDKLNNLTTDPEEKSDLPGNPMWEKLNKIKFNKN
jgi:uncharacterized metal-binding protein YceD (DUF177 family)